MCSRARKKTPELLNSNQINNYRSKSLVRPQINEIITTKIYTDSFPVKRLRLTENNNNGHFDVNLLRYVFQIKIILNYSTVPMVKK